MVRMICSVVNTLRAEYRTTAYMRWNACALSQTNVDSFDLIFKQGGGVNQTVPAYALASAPEQSRCR